MYYHFTLLIFFRPFRDLDITGSSTSPRKICSEATQNVFVLIKSYKDLYTLRRIPSFMPYMVLTTHLAYLLDVALSAKDIVSEAAELASLSYLEEMGLAHDFSRRALQIVDLFSHLWGVDTRDNRALRLVRRRLQGKEKPNHPAKAIPGSDMFFLPAHRSLQGYQLEDFTASETTTTLFPQQRRQRRDELLDIGPEHDEVEE
jgi:hypothetical protein